MAFFYLILSSRKSYDFKEFLLIKEFCIKELVKRCLELGKKIQLFIDYRDFCNKEFYIKENKL